MTDAVKCGSMIIKDWNLPHVHIHRKIGFLSMCGEKRCMHDWIN